jgi:hypothetical protein
MHFSDERRKELQSVVYVSYVVSFTLAQFMLMVEMEKILFDIVQLSP